VDIKLKWTLTQAMQLSLRKQRMNQTEVVEELKKRGLGELLSTERSQVSSNAQYSAVHISSTDKWTALFNHMNDGCYGRLSNQKSGIRYIIVYIRDVKDLTEEVQIAHLDYLFNRSPLKDVYISKDAAQAYKDGYVIMDCDQPGNYMMLGMISVRHIWEANYKVRTWHKMVQAGVNEDLAYIIGHGLFNMTEDRVEFLGDNSHSGLYIDQVSTNFVKRWMARDNTYARKDTYYATGQYTGVANSFQSDAENHRSYTYSRHKPVKLFKGLYEGFIKKYHKENSGKSYISPFEKTFKILDYSSESFSMARVAEILAKYQTQILEAL
jgi:hypothetical protein